MIGTMAWALTQDTIDAIGSAAAIGMAVTTGELTPDAASQIVALFRKDKLSNGEIWDIFKVLVDTSVPTVPGVSPAVASNDNSDSRMYSGRGRGMGAFVQAAHARGLTGRELAAAIHAEQARRGRGRPAGDHDANYENRSDTDNRRDTGLDRERGRGSRGRPGNGNMGNRNRGNR